jgi:glycosyltransferase involved in cell wall biosynthesis
MISHNYNDIELSIVMPCLNESETLSICIIKARRYLQANNIKGEIVIGDNGSTDGSQDIARSNGARVINISERGYGNALTGAINAAYGKYVIMGDSDDSYDFSDLNPFLDKLREGYELVMGNRFMGDIRPNSMPFLNRYLGNPVLSFIGRLFIRSDIGDFHCGLRGFRQDIVAVLGLQTKGMEFASEMIVKATVHKFKIIEVPIVFSRDGRSGPSHLRPWQDGWRHLRFLMSYSPSLLFLTRELFYFAGGLLLRIFKMIKRIFN